VLGLSVAAAPVPCQPPDEAFEPGPLSSEIGVDFGSAPTVGWSPRLPSCRRAAIGHDQAPSAVHWRPHTGALLWRIGSSARDCALAPPHHRTCNRQRRRERQIHPAGPPPYGGGYGPAGCPQFCW